MLEYDKIDMPQGTDLNKVDGSRNCIICHYWHFPDINVKF